MVKQGSSQSVAGKWQGRYTYGYSNQLREFSFELKPSRDGDYAGRMFDDKQSQVGGLSGRFRFPILTLTRESSSKSWLRVYEPLEFRAEISDDGRSLSGVWTNSASRGSWHAERVGGALLDFGTADQDEADFEKVSEPDANSAVASAPANAGDMSNGNPPSIFSPIPSVLNQPAVGPGLPQVFKTRTDQNIAPSISVDTISSDSVNSLNNAIQSAKVTGYSSAPVEPSLEAGEMPAYKFGTEAPTDGLLAPSADQKVCSRCGAPKGGFGFCLSCGHSFELSQ